MIDNYQKQLIKESVYILRECYAQFNNVTILFSGGKDSVALLELARIAFAPLDVPFSILQIDTGYNFKEITKFSKESASRYNVNLIVGNVKDDIDAGSIKEDPEEFGRNKLQSYTLLRCIKENNIDCCIGGGRRDEEKARAKERVFSHRNKSGSWEPDNQKPEFWNLFTVALQEGEHYRVFPLSNWTEKDIWKFIVDWQIQIPELYFAKKRNVVKKEGVYYIARSPFDLDKFSIENAKVRCRTVGDITNTGFFKSNATTLGEIYQEIRDLKTSERSIRADDKFSETSMEDRKREGYF